MEVVLPHVVEAVESWLAIFIYIALWQIVLLVLDFGWCPAGAVGLATVPDFIIDFVAFVGDCLCECDDENANYIFLHWFVLCYLRL